MALPSKSEGFRVIISGGGLAGLALANTLQHAGIDYVLLEARAVIAPQVGASLGMMPNGCRILDQLGCYDEIFNMVEPLQWAANHNSNGDYIGTVSDGLQLIAKRHGYQPAFLDRQLVLAVLYSHILDKSKILLNKRFSSVDHSTTGVTVHCTDGTSYHGDLLAGADGVFSKVRQEMWRAADREEPGVIPDKDRTSMRAEYQVLFGISTATGEIPIGRYDVTFMKDFSTMLITGKDAKVYWFLYKRMDQVYTSGNIPKYTQQDAESFAERHADVNLMPNQSVKFRDVWKNRTSYTLVATEEAEYQCWTWGRFACLGDSIHKMTPNAGAGGNAAIESAAALANSIKAIIDSNGPRPSMEAVKQALLAYQGNRDQRTLSVIKAANKLTRIHALKGLEDQITAYYAIPNGGDLLIDMQSDLMVGATMLDYLPPPPRSLKATLPFNPEQGVGKKESVLFRVFFAFPFLLLLGLAAKFMVADAAYPQIGKILESRSITWDGGSVAIPESFYRIKWLDDLWRPVTVVFAPWIFDIDHIASFQIFTFLTDFGLLYSIFLIESTRRANLLTFSQLPLFFGLAGQLRGIGVVGQLYYLLHYSTAQIANFGASDMRLTDLSYTRSVLPTMIFSYYIPQFLSLSHPSMTTRYVWNWVWQMFPVWATLIQQVFKRTILPDSVEHDRLHNPKRDLATIRLTIGASVTLSALVWLYTITKSPYSPLTLFVPGVASAKDDWMDIVRNFIQYDHLFCFGGAFLWLGYLFHDLKRAGMVRQSWIRIITEAVLTTVALGPGAAVGLGWLWREDVLANKRHKCAVIKGWEDEKKATWGSAVEEPVVNGHAEGNGHAMANGDIKTNGHAKANGHAEKVNGVLKH